METTMAFAMHVDHDLAKLGGLKIFEGPTVSNALKAAVAKS